jgi:hypothetical protein
VRRPMDVQPIVAKAMLERKMNSDSPGGRSQEQEARSQPSKHRGEWPQRLNKVPGGE